MSRYSAQQSSSSSAHKPSTLPPNMRVTGLFTDEDHILRIEMKESTTKIADINDMTDMLFPDLQAKLEKQLPGLDLNSEKFKKRNANLSVHFASNYKLGSNPKLADLRPDMNKLLFVFHSEVPIARQFLSDKKMEVLEAQLAAATVSGSSKDKGKALNDSSTNIASEKKIRQYEEYIRAGDAAQEEKDAIIERLTIKNQHLEQVKQDRNKTIKSQQDVIVKLTNVLRALRVRILLDQALEKLKLKGDVSSTAKPTINPNVVAQIVHHIAQRWLTKSREETLSESALWAIFDSRPGTFRSPGNQAAHNAPDDDIAAAVLDSTYDPPDRQILRELFKWVKGYEP